MLPVPQRLLNRRNAELYQKVLGLQSQVHERQSTVRMENGLNEDTRAQLNEANRALILLRRQQSEISSSTERDREKVTKVTVEVERLSKHMQDLTNRILVASRQTDQISVVVDDARAKLKTVEEEGQRLEEVVAEWVRENRETEHAEQTAQIVMGKIAQAIRQRLDHCNTISAQCRQLDGDFEDGKEASSRLRTEVAHLKEQSLIEMAEVENLKNRMNELATVCSALDEAIGIKSQIMHRLVEQTAGMKRSKDEFRVRVELEEQASRELEKLDVSIKARKDKFAQSVRQNELTCRDLEIDLANLERQILITAMQREKLQNQRMNKDDEFRAATERLDELQKLLETVVASERQIQFQRDDAKKADICSNALADSYTIRLNSAVQRFEKSQQRLRDEINKNRGAAINSNQLNEMIERCQKRLSQTVVEDRVKEEAAMLDARINVMSDEIDKSTAKLSYARGLNSDDPEVIRRKQLMKERVSALEFELEVATKEHHEKDRDVRTAARRVSAETIAGNLLQSDVQKVQAENSSLENENQSWYREVDMLVQGRQQKAAIVESLWANVNNAEQRLAGKAEGVDEVAAAKLQMERDAATRLSQIEADRVALQQLLNNQENERHRSAMRLGEMKDTIDILKARYGGVVHLLQTKMGDADEVVDELSAEEMQAKMMMQRAEKREELLSRGDDLDAKICAVEKEILILDRALNQAKEFSMDFGLLAAPPELDEAWQVVQRVDQERRIAQQTRELAEELDRMCQQIMQNDQRFVFILEKHAAMEEARKAAGEEVLILQRELRTIQKSKHLTTVEHNRARVISKKLVITKASAVPARSIGSVNNNINNNNQNYNPSQPQQQQQFQFTSSPAGLEQMQQQQNVNRPSSSSGKRNNNNQASSSTSSASMYALPRMPRAQALHQALSGISAIHYHPQKDKNYF